MAFIDKLDFSWFLDAEQDGPSSSTDLSTKELLRRPWRAYWPPRSEDDLRTWLRCEYSEVLTWRFNSNNPFDRPWRHWARTVLSKKEEKDIQQELCLLLRENAESHCHSLMSIPDGIIDSQIAPLPRIKIDSFLYLAPLKLYSFQKPYRSRLPHGSGLRRTNIIECRYQVEVRDVRGYEHLFTLDKSGFQFVQFPTTTSNWTEENVLAEYLPELPNWLKTYFGSKEVLIYAYNLRNNHAKREENEPWKPPIFRTHCDVTDRSCAKRIKLQFPNREEEIMEQRYRFVNVWRSINGQEIDSPLAFCDYRTVSKDDLVEADMVYPHFCEEGYEVLYNPSHRWFYKKGVSKSEVVVFKLDDTLPTAAKFTPHAAFMDPSALGDCKRASIEARAIIVG